MSGNHHELNNSEIVTIAVAALGGAAQPVDLEDVAIKAYELAPGNFSWKKYKDKIDLGIVRFSLQDACRKMDPPLLKGTVKRGYMLTQAGSELINSTAIQKMTSALKDTPRKQSAEAKLVAERKRLENSQAYHKFIIDRSQDITKIDFQEFTRVNDYFPAHLREQRFEMITNATKGDPNLEKLWIFLKDNFL